MTGLTHERKGRGPSVKLCLETIREEEGKGRMAVVLIKTHSEYHVATHYSAVYNMYILYSGVMTVYSQ